MYVKKILKIKKKITKNKTTKKIQNNKKKLEYTIIPFEEHCLKMEKLENEKKIYKKTKVQRT